MTFGEMRSSGTHSRLNRLYTASCLPSADSRMLGCSAFALRRSLMLGVKGIRRMTYAIKSTPAAIPSAKRLFIADFNLIRLLRAGSKTALKWPIVRLYHLPERSVACVVFSKEIPVFVPVITAPDPHSGMTGSTSASQEIRASQASKAASAVRKGMAVDGIFRMALAARFSAAYRSRCNHAHLILSSLWPPAFAGLYPGMTPQSESHPSRTMGLPFAEFAKGQHFAALPIFQSIPIATSQ